jgi:hypothetical protein
VGSVIVIAMDKRTRRMAKAARKSVARGERPVFQLSVERRQVADLPGLEFDGDRPASVVEAARRAIAAELDLRPDQIQVEPVGAGDDPVRTPPADRG